MKDFDSVSCGVRLEVLRLTDFATWSRRGLLVRALDL